jgi:hypothetical protein
VTIDRIRVADVDRVQRAACFPRMCTQAVFAPVVEWLLHNALLPVEDSRRRVLTVEIDTREGTMRLTKHFRLLHAYASCRGEAGCHAAVAITIYVHARTNLLTISAAPYG